MLPRNYQLSTAAELDAVALNNASVLYVHNSSAAHPPINKHLAGGWTCKWACKGGRTLILVPSDARTFRIYKEGQIKLYQSAGFTKEQAEHLYNIKVGFKQEMLELIYQAFSTDSLTMYWICYPGKINNFLIMQWKNKLIDMGFTEHTKLGYAREEAMYHIIRSLRAKDKASLFGLDNPYVANAFDELDDESKEWKARWKDVLPSAIRFANIRELKSMKG